MPDQTEDGGERQADSGERQVASGGCPLGERWARGGVWAQHGCRAVQAPLSPADGAAQLAEGARDPQ